MRGLALVVGWGVLLVGSAVGAQSADCQAVVDGLARGRSAVALSEELHVPRAFVQACAHVKALQERQGARRAAREGARAARRREPRP